MVEVPESGRNFGIKDDDQTFEIASLATQIETTRRVFYRPGK